VKPRILFLDVAVAYINPTRNLLPRLVDQAGDVTFFGPGYVPSEVLRRGLHSFIAEHGPFDVALATEHIVFALVPGDPRTETLYRRNYRRFHFPVSDLGERGRILDDLGRSACVTVAMLLESDFYDFSQQQIDHIHQRFQFVATWGAQFVRPISSLSRLRLEHFAHRATDRWHDFVAANAGRVVPLLHFVADDEFCFVSLAHRPRTWSVPGTRYEARQRAVEALSRRGITTRRRLPVAGMLSRAGLRPFSWHWFLAYYQDSFREEIRQSRYAFTCGSALGYPIRKFFEIPAMGSVLACVPCQGFEELGFRHGINAFASPPESLPDLTRELEADSGRAQAVADAGRELVATRHSLNARAEQLALALERLVSGRWRGAVWRAGELVLHPDHHSPPTAAAASA
jgi:hypothetical protein